MRKTRSLHFRDLAKSAARAGADKKALDIAVLDTRKSSDVADYFVIAGAESFVQMRAIYEGIVAALQDKGVRPLHQEGHAKDRWMALDYGGLVVHILLSEARTFYRLDHLWNNPRSVAWK